jgi:alkane 1-monooxygenase
MTSAPVRPAGWRDGKRYAWLLGVLVPTLPFIVYGLVQLTGLAIFWFWGPILIFGVFPPLDLLFGLDSENPPDSVLKWLEQDRYYRWCTYAFLPLQYTGSCSRAGCGRAAT